MIGRHLLAIPLAFAIGLLEILAASTPVAAAEPITCALIPDNALGFADSATFQLLQVELSKDADFILLERAEIEKVLEEQTLQMAFGPQGGSSRRRCGALLKADLLVFLRAGENILEGNRTVRFVDVVVADSSTGLRILTETHLWDEEKPDDTVVWIADNVKKAPLRVGEGISAIVAVPSFVSDDLTRDYDTMQEAYAELIRRALGSIPGVVVVELAEARAFAQEESLSGVQFAGRPLLPLYVLGRYRNEGIGEDRKVTITMEVRQGEQRVTEERLEGITQRDAAQYLTTAANKMCLDVLNTASSAFDADKEVVLINERAMEFEGLGYWERALNLIETSLLLKSDSIEMHRMAVRLCARLSHMKALEALKGQRFAELAEESLTLNLIGCRHLEPVLMNSDIELIYLDSFTKQRFDTFLRDLWEPGERLQRRRELPPELKELISRIQRIESNLILDKCRQLADRGRLKDEVRWFSRHAYENLIWLTLSEEDRYSVQLRLLEIMSSNREQWQSYFLDGIVRHGGVNSAAYLSFLDRVEQLPDPYSKGEAIIARVFVQTEDVDERLRLLERAIEVSAATDEPTRDRLSREIFDIRSGRNSVSPARTPIESAERILSASESSTTSAGESVQFTPIDGIPKGTRGWISTIPGVDVLWDDKALYRMESPEKCETFYETKGLGRSDSTVVFDGENIWLAREGLVVVLGLRDGSRGSITAKEGLPPGSIKLAASGPGRVCLIGSFGRTWIANAFFDGKAITSIDVFHQARLLSGVNDDSGVAFSPIFVVSLPDPTGSGKPTVLVGRQIEGQPSSYPLIVNPSERSVTVLRERFSPRLTGAKMATNENALYWVSNLCDVLPSVRLCVWSNNSDETRRKYDSLSEHLGCVHRTHLWRMDPSTMKIDSVNGNIQNGFTDKCSVVFEKDDCYVLTVNDIWFADLGDGCLYRVNGDIPEAGNRWLFSRSHHYGIIMKSEDRDAHWYKVKFPSDPSILRNKRLQAATVIDARLTDEEETVLPRDPYDYRPLVIRIYPRLAYGDIACTTIERPLYANALPNVRDNSIDYGSFFMFEKEGLSSSTCIVLCGSDQVDPLMKEQYGNLFRLWTSPKHFSIGTADTVDSMSTNGPCLFTMDGTLVSGTTPSASKTTITDGVGEPLSGAKMEMRVYLQVLSGTACNSYGADLYRNSQHWPHVYVDLPPIPDSGTVVIPECQGQLHAVLRFSHPNYGVAERDWDSGRFQKDRESVPLVKKGSNAWRRAMKGKVIDPSGNPIEGAVVSDLYDYYGRRFRVFTDERGEFCVYHVPYRAELDNGLLRAGQELTVQMFDPARPDLMPWVGGISNSAKTVVSLEDELYFHRFVFEDSDGNVQHPADVCPGLEVNGLMIDPFGYLMDGWQRDVFMNGSMIRLGTYEISTANGKTYFPMSVTGDSPEIVTFKQKCGLPIGSVLSGRVVDRLTEKALPDVFVVLSSWQFAEWVTDLKEEEWALLQRFSSGMPIYGKELDPIREGNMTVLGATRTDTNGRFEVKYDSAEELKGILVFQKGYLPALVYAGDLNTPEEAMAILDTIPLSRAATLKLALSSEEGILSMCCRFIDANSGEGVWADVLRIGSRAQPISSLLRNQVNTLQVPAGVRMKILITNFLAKGGYDDLWLPVEIELKPGEILDLGEVSLKAK